MPKTKTQSLDVLLPTDMWKGSNVNSYDNPTRRCASSWLNTHEMHGLLTYNERMAAEKNYVAAAHQLYPHTKIKRYVAGVNDMFSTTHEMSAHLLNIALYTVGYTKGMPRSVVRDAKNLMNAGVISMYPGY